MRGRPVVAFLLFGVALAAVAQPRLVGEGPRAALEVAGRPFLILGGELSNSAASTVADIRALWPRLRRLNLNTVLAPVYWEVIEPEPGRYDWRAVDALIEGARQNGLRLILLWFGAYKNSMSSYAPEWVKLDPQRYPRARDAAGVPQEILTPFAPANREADRRAFVALLRHLAERDRRRQTVIMVQVENEVGMLPSARDHHPLAERAYRAPVPAALMARLRETPERLPEALVKAWRAQGSPEAGDWETVFGPGEATEEAFTAWSLARYVDALAAAGKAVHPLPMFVNAALNRPGRRPGSGYPSGGPLPHLYGLWRTAAPHIDLLSPDFYTPRFEHWCDAYSRPDNPLFIPEHHFDESVGAKALFAVGHYGALGFSPFSVDTVDGAPAAELAAAYALLAALEAPIHAARRAGRLRGVWFDEALRERRFVLGGYRFTARHDYTLGWSPGAAEPDWPDSGAIVMQLGPDDFLLAGQGVVFTVETLEDGRRAGILRAEAGRWVGGAWRAERRLNGDQTHQGRHLRLPYGEWGMQRARLYTYE
ncbi:MAG: beta-galactosidase [Gammaproteobacteria bacterium]|nr:MAG: beta-galactosidase [Gammaproteobacteria bacterium]